MKKQPDEILEFLGGYPSTTGEIALRLREIITSSIPDIREEFDKSARILGYGLGPGYAGLICTIIPSQKGVKLGIVRGAQISDANGVARRFGQTASLHCIQEILRFGEGRGAGSPARGRRLLAKAIRACRRAR